MASEYIEKIYTRDIYINELEEKLNDFDELVRLATKERNEYKELFEAGNKSEVNGTDFYSEVKGRGTALFRSKKLDFSPSNWVGKKKVRRGQTQSVILKPYLKLHQIADTNSMLPTIDGTHEILVLPKKHFTIEDIKVGDIIIWKKKGKINSVCHRVVKISNKGFVTQGDNLKFNDGWITWEEIQSVVVAIIY